MGEFCKLPRCFSYEEGLWAIPLVFPNGDNFVHWETLAVFGDIFGCHSWEWLVVLLAFVGRG